MKKRDSKKSKLKNKSHPFGILYLMTIGVLLSWVMVAGIIDTTIFARNHSLTLRWLIVIVPIYGILFLNKYTRLILWSLLAGGLIFIAIGFFHVPTIESEPHLAHRFAVNTTQTIEFLTGSRAYHPRFERYIIWTLKLVFPPIVVSFSFHKFNFWVLSMLSITTTSLAITSPYFRAEIIFYVFIFCILSLLFIHIQKKNMQNIVNPVRYSLFTKMMLPIIATIILFANFLPRPTEGGAFEFFEDLVTGPIDFINDIFSDITTPSQFSISQVGFGGDGRLGGDISPNNELFMTIEGVFPRNPLYLVGTTRDTYTGTSWESRNSRYNRFEFGRFEDSLDILEHALRPILFSHLQLFNMFDLDEFILMDSTQIHELWHEYDPAGFYRIFHLGETSAWHLNTSNQWAITLADLIPDGRTLSINTGNRRVENIFYHGLLVSVNFDNNKNLYRNRDGGVRAGTRMPRESEYSIEFIHFFEGLPSQLSLQQSRAGIFVEVATILAEFRERFGYDLEERSFYLRAESEAQLEMAMINGEELSLEELLIDYLIPRANNIRQIYTQLPRNLPTRIEDLAREITQNATSDYHAMTLLEQFLATSFPYTLTPGPSPASQDFVDHFLFELQRGYCVHFATAFVIMARTLGMPARYVEGFYVNPPLNHRGEFNVLNNMAHAWAEVYFEGIGWRTFEPTPSGTLAGQPTSPRIDNVTEFTPIPENNQSTPDTPNEEVNENDSNPILPEDNNDTPTNENNSALNNEASNTTNNNINHVFEQRNIFGIIWSLFLVIISITLLIFRISYLQMKRIRGRRRKPRTQVLFNYKRIRAYLSVFGFVINDEETAIQFALRIKNLIKLDIADEELLITTARIYSKARFSKEEITPAEVRTLGLLLRALDKKARLEFGTWKYYLYRNILGKI